MLHWSRNPLKFTVDQDAAVQLYPEEEEPVNILNIKRGIISALLVPLTEQEEQEQEEEQRSSVMVGVTHAKRSNTYHPYTVQLHTLGLFLATYISQYLAVWLTVNDWRLSYVNSFSVNMEVPGSTRKPHILSSVNTVNTVNTVYWQLHSEIKTQ